MHYCVQIRAPEDFARSQISNVKMNSARNERVPICLPRIITWYSTHRFKNPEMTELLTWTSCRCKNGFYPGIILASNGIHMNNSSSFTRQIRVHATRVDLPSALTDFPGNVITNPNRTKMNRFFTDPELKHAPIHRAKWQAIPLTKKQPSITPLPDFADLYIYIFFFYFGILHSR